MGWSLKYLVPAGDSSVKSGRTKNGVCAGSWKNAGCFLFSLGLMTFFVFKMNPEMHPSIFGVSPEFNWSNMCSKAGHQPLTWSQCYKTDLEVFLVSVSLNLWGTKRQKNVKAGSMNKRIIVYSLWYLKNSLCLCLNPNRPYTWMWEKNGQVWTEHAGGLHTILGLCNAWLTPDTEAECRRSARGICLRHVDRLVDRLVDRHVDRRNALLTPDVELLWSCMERRPFHSAPLLTCSVVHTRREMPHASAACSCSAAIDLASSLFFVQAGSYSKTHKKIL